MDYKELIESGKLELYALGALESDEAKEIESLLETNSTLKSEYDAIADALTTYGKSVSETPSIDILEKAKAEIEVLEKSTDTTRVVSMSSANSNNVNKTAQWLAIAATTLLVGSIGLNLKLNSDLQKAESDYLALESKQSLMAANTVKLEEGYAYLDNMIDQISAPGVIKTPMAGTENYKGYQSTVFWDKASSKVILSSTSLPKLDETSQYQLWAIVDGVPVDAGVFTDADQLKEMKEISGNAVAFAVTIEPLGGSETPTLEKMCMLGNVAS